MIWDTTLFPAVECSLAEAQSLIGAQLHPLESKQHSRPVSDALSFINSEEILANQPKPFYDQSTRDGFALAEKPLLVEDNRAVYKVTGEVAAGCLKTVPLGPGEAVRIMTGAMIPVGCSRVVPFELCSESGGRVNMQSTALSCKQLYIRARGSEVQKGKLLVPTGVRLCPEHLLMLAESGCTEVRVSQLPEVAVVCTGSELVSLGEKVEPGQKISGNGILLPALLRACGGICKWSVTVEDQLETIRRTITEILSQEPDMIITTGGMGPGKFDLMEQVFADLGGQVIYNRLRVRPGKFTLFGMIGQVPLFALPGPPPAVRLLFYELIVPALAALQGHERRLSPLMPAILEHTLSVKKTGHLSLKGAVAKLTKRGLQVYPAGRAEPINAIIHLGEDRLEAEYGESVQVRLLGDLQGLTA